MNAKPTAYVVEDNPDAYIVFTKALEMAGYDVDGAQDGAVAQQRLTEIVPYLVLLDLHMPNVTGAMLLSQIRADARLENTRVWLVTADARLAKELSEDVDLVLLKPISFVQLNQLAERVIGKPKN